MITTEQISYRKIIPSFGVMSSVALLTTLFGVITTKIIALYGGPEYIGIFSLYQKLSGVIVPVLSMGAITIIVQRISVAKTQEVISKILYTSRYLLAIQVIFGVLVAGILSEPIAKLLFNNEIYNQYILSVRLVIIMSIIILISRSIISIINGRVELKKISIINLSMASVTMVSSYFLISYGDIGLSLIIGSGSVVGIMVGLYFMHKVYFN